MQRSHKKPKTFRDKLYASIEPGQQEQMDNLFIGSIRGSDRIEGVRRSSNSYGVKSPSELPRSPRDER